MIRLCSRCFEVARVLGRLAKHARAPGKMWRTTEATTGRLERRPHTAHRELL